MTLQPAHAQRPPSECGLAMPHATTPCSHACAGRRCRQCAHDRRHGGVGKWATMMLHGRALKSWRGRLCSAARKQSGLFFFAWPAMAVARSTKHGGGHRRHGVRLSPQHAMQPHSLPVCQGPTNDFTLPHPTQNMDMVIEPEALSHFFSSDMRKPSHVHGTPTASPLHLPIRRRVALVSRGSGPCRTVDRRRGREAL